MGIAAAGNSGTVLANILAPRLATAVGWQNVFGLALIPLGAVLIPVLGDGEGRPGARDDPDLRRGLPHPDTWWFCFFYSVTFGGYVGLSSFLPIFMRDPLWQFTAVN